MSDSNWVSCINYVLLHWSGCIVHPDSSNMMWWGDRVTFRSLMSHLFLSENTGKKVRNFNSRLPSFLRHALINLRAEESRLTPPPTSPLSRHWLQCFPLSICHKCTPSIIPTALWTSCSPSTAPASKPDTRYLFITPSLEGEEHKSIQPLHQGPYVLSQQKSHSVR